MGGIELVAVALALVAAAAAGAAVDRRLRRPAGRPMSDRASTGALPRPHDVLEGLPVALVVVDARAGVLVANRAARELGITRTTLDAVPGLADLVHLTRVEGGVREAEVEPTAVRPGKAPAVYRARLAPIGGSTVAVVLEDVTEARRLEDVRRDFVANVSHELKTPVGALALLAEALLDASTDDAAVRRFAGRVQLEADRMARLVQELMDLSRLQGAEPLPEPAVVAVDRVVAEAVDRTRTAARVRAITLVRSGERGLSVLGDEAQLVTAVSNLLSNAVAYSPDGTRVTIGVRATEDRQVEVNVTDEGIGIAEKDQQRVFERFYRADPARSRATGGTGLGLAIVKHVATNHGGSISVRSTEGCGSTFTLRLPAAAPSTTATAAATTPGRDAR